MINDEIMEITTFTQFLKSFENLIIKSLPMVVGMELSIITTVVNMYFIIGKENVIGIGFGTIFANLVVKGLLLSINSTITSLMSTFFKQHNYFKIGISYQRGLILNGVFLILITPVLAASEKILVFFNVSEPFAKTSMQYVWEMLPALYAFTYFDCTKNYLKAMGIDYPVLIIQTFTSIFHIYLSKNFIVYLDLGVRGAAWAKNFSSCASALLIYLYIFKYQSTHPSWIEWDKRSLKSICYFVYNLLNQGIKIFIQAISFEIMAIIAIGLSDDEFSVCVCLIFTAQSLYMFFLGVALTASSKIRELFKKQEFEKGKRQASHYITTSVVLGLLMCLILNIFKQHWIELFYMDNETSNILQGMIGLFCITLIIGGCQIMIGCILNAIGEQAFVTNFQLIAQYLIGIGAGMFLAYEKELGIHGLWTGWACGLAVSSFCLLVKLALLDWEKAAKNLLVEIEETK